SDEPIGALLTDLRDRLVRAGYAVASDFGFDDGVRIPLVAGDVELPGTWRVAVLVDDEAYVNEPSVRRRDRYWLERLESRGWAVIRTFSTSLFIDPEGQASLVVNAIKRARALELSDSVRVPVLGDEWAAPADGPGGETVTGGKVVAEGEVVTSDENVAGGETIPGGETVTGGAALPRDPNWAEKLRNEAAVKRGPRPDVAKGLSLAAYTDDQLDEMVTWIAADGAERSRPEFVDALRKELGIEGRGMQVDTILGHVVDRSGLAVGLGLGDSGSDALSDSGASPDAVSRLSGSRSSSEALSETGSLPAPGSRSSSATTQRSSEAAQHSSESALRSPEVSQRSPYSADPASEASSKAVSEGARSPSDSSKAASEAGRSASSASQSAPGAGRSASRSASRGKRK
ncbi:MAG: hypothetical protein ACFNYN_01070, partial [Peptidiphaga gingivicola]